MKSIAIAGNIGKDAVSRTTQSGDNVTSWSVGVEERNGQDKRTIWFDCSLWGKRGESLGQYLTKGSKVAVSGELSTREHDGKTYLTVRVNEVSLQGGGQQRSQASDQHYTAPRDNPVSRPVTNADFDDEIPF